MATYNELTCLFGHHQYNEEETEDKDGWYIHLCKICKRSGYRKLNTGLEEWLNYDEKGNCVHRKWNDEMEVWTDFDEEGNYRHERWNGGDEYWFDKHGNRTQCKYADS